METWTQGFLKACNGTGTKQSSLITAIRLKKQAQREKVELQ